MKRYIGTIVNVIIDRPLGSLHPKYGYEYHLNYGYLPNTVSGDGEEIDAYIIDLDYPVKKCCGKVIAVILRENDNEDKLVVSTSGRDFTKKQNIKKTRFQEHFFKTKILR